MIMIDRGAIETIEDRQLSQLIMQALAVRTELYSGDFNAGSNRERFQAWLMDQTAESCLEVGEIGELHRADGFALAAGGRVGSSDRAILAAAVGGAGIGAGSLASRTSPVSRPALSNRPMASPTLKRRVLGDHLRELRENAGITTERAALSIRGSHSKITRMECGRVGFKERDMADLLALYGVGPGIERDTLFNLAREANTPGWWQEYSTVLPTWVQPYFGLEAGADFIREYESQFVPGLLQTEKYARSVIQLRKSAMREPPGAAVDSELMRLVQARMSRQEILEQADPPRLWVVLDEAVLRRNVGGDEVMRAQLQHLIEMCHHPAVTLQILSFCAGAHRAMGGPFTIFRYIEPAMRDVVFIEQLTSALYLDKQGEVDAYLEVIEEVCLQSEPSAETPGILQAMLDRL